MLSISLFVCSVGWWRGVAGRTRINKVTLHRARLVVGWVTMIGWVY